MSKSRKVYTVLDGHPVPYSLTMLDAGRPVEFATSGVRKVAEAFVAAKGMKIDRWDGAYAFYSAVEPAAPGKFDATIALLASAPHKPAKGRTFKRTFDEGMR